MHRREDPTPSAPAGTAFDISVTVSGGPYYKLQFDLPPGNSVVYSLKQPTNGLVCGAPQGAAFTCYEQGVTPIAPGTFQFGIEVATPIAPGTTTSGQIWGDGLRQGTCALQWYGG